MTEKDKDTNTIPFEPYGWPSSKVQKRFWEKVQSSTDSKCMEWTSAKTQGGHGRFSWKGVSWGAHRFAWYLEHGKSPENETLDHLCRNPSCVNVDHLEEVSLAENLRRQAKAQEPQKKCANGHSLLVEDNVYVNPNTGHRQCRPCNRELDRKRYARRYEKEKELATHSSEAVPKLDEDKVREIRDLYSEGWSQRKIAREYRVSQPMIGFITRNESWSDDRWDPKNKTYRDSRKDD